MLVVAHRGFHPHGDENTVAAFRRAQAIGADMVELDVQQTADGELVVLHDEHWNGKPIGDLRLEDLWRSVPAGVAPRLQDALDSVEIPVLVEIKQADPARVLRVARARAIAPLVVASFDPEVVSSLVSEIDIKRGLILGEEEVAVTDPESEILEQARLAHADLLVLQKGLATDSVLAAMEGSLDRPFVWDVSDTSALQALTRDERVAGVVTDRPDLALRARESVS